MDSREPAANVLKWNTLLRFLDISRSRAPTAWICGVLVAGIVLSVGLFCMSRGWEEREQVERAAAITHEQIEKLRVSILRSMEVLHSIEALHRIDAQMNRKQFRQFVRGALARQPELQAVSWNPLVPRNQRGDREAAARIDGLADFTFREQAPDGRLVPESIRSEYVPVYLIEPLAGNREALGYDLNSNESRRRSMEEARDTGRPVATAPIRLAQGLENEAGFLVLLPVYRGGVADPATVTERRERLDGFGVAVFKVAKLVGDSFRELRNKGIIGSLFDSSPGGELIYGRPAGKDDAVAWLEVAGQRWALTFRPSDDLKIAGGRRQSWWVLCAGLAFTLLSSAYLFGGWCRTREIGVANAALENEVVVRKRAEAAAATANQAKSDFLASMSHEIRTPLNAILGYAQLLQRDSGLTREQRDSIHGIGTAGHHLLGLINEILDLSKIEAGHADVCPGNFDLRELGRSLATTFKPLCAGKYIGFRLQIDESVPARVRGDEGKLRQILINLLGNAVKFTATGEVFLGVSRRAGDRWMFEVVDTGMGIPPDEQMDIFKPFHQGSGAQHRGGTGLGLAIAQRQVGLLGGNLELQSERGLGSRFFFEIPLPEVAAPAEERLVQVARLSAGHNVRALLVDDHAGNRDVMGRMLESLGCEVRHAVDARGTFAVIEDWMPDIVFLDLLLPDVTGTEVVRRLLHHPDTSHLKLVVHSASALPQHREEALAAGCIEFLSKPVSYERLCACLTNHLGAAFDFTEMEKHGGEGDATALIRLALPEKLCARLAVAAELHSTTALKSALEELRTRGPDARRLAESIRNLMRSFDMNGIQQLLTRKVTPVPESPFDSNQHAVASPERSV